MGSGRLRSKVGYFSAHLKKHTILPPCQEAELRWMCSDFGGKEIRLVNGAPELGRSERGAEAIAEARI